VTHALRVAAVALLASVGASTPSLAQAPSPPTLPNPEDVGRFRIGPVRVTPSIALSQLGVDTNVFNELDDPKQDTTAIVGPKAEFWSRLGPRAVVYGTTSVDYHYFQRYESQRSFGTTNAARLDVDLGRLMPFAEGSFTSTRVRPGYEIDARARRNESLGRAGVGLDLGSRTELLAWGVLARYRYDATEEFLGTNLANALNRDSTGIGSTLNVTLTPLTTFVVEAEVQQDRFVRSPERDADTLRVTPGFRFKPFALIDGNLFVGYRRFDTLSPLVPDYSGLAAAVDLGYNLRATRFVGRYSRDVTYSFETTEPYYLLTDAGLDVTQKITNDWDAIGRVGRFTLDYEVVMIPGLPARTDRGLTYGGGVGYRLGDRTRIGMDIDYYERRSVVDVARSYDGVRVGLSVTYGTLQR
jgi:hypothetical protein